jgi:putative membrane-bound dehydrogenase-like protein
MTFKSQFLLPTVFASIFGGTWFLSAAVSEPARKTPWSPEQARAAFKVAPGLKVELVASEPQIESPVAMTFDENGRLFVVEMLDYPNGPTKGQPPEGRVKVLEDCDGDGFYETSRVYADKLLYANGVLPWKDGPIVTVAPRIIHLRDTDHDGVADRRDVLFEGFSTQNPQLRVSFPTLGPDGWIYVANGLRGGTVRRVAASRGRESPENSSGARAPGSPIASDVIKLGGQDFRFDLIHGREEGVSGMGQYGLAFDDWNNRFVCDNHHHIRHVVLPNRYLKRNPYLAVPEVLEDTSELEASVPGAGARVYAISKNWTTSNLHAGRFTAACGVYVYRSSLLPKPYRGAVFTCEPTGNLIHCELLSSNGATYRSRPPTDGVEFLASPDDWCRPVFITSGPDGAMYVVDMVRAVIEHPEWMPDELKNRPDLLWGKHHGRIWRIKPEGRSEAFPKPHLSNASTAELVKLLGHPDEWWRTTAQRIILERQDPAAIEPLREMLRSDEPRARLLAAWLLENRGELSEADNLALLHDKHPRVREQAVALSERWLPASAAVRKAVTELARDSDGQLRFQVALSLGFWDDDGVVKPLAEIARAAADDHWTRTAIASAVPTRAGLLIERLLSGPMDHAGIAGLLHDLAAVVGARQDAIEIARVLRGLHGLNGLAAVPTQLNVLGGLADGTGRRGKQLAGVLVALPEADQPLARWTSQVFGQAALIAADSHRPQAERISATRLLSHASWDVAGPVLKKLLVEESDQAVRLSAVGALAGQPTTASADALLGPWRSLSPVIRREAIAALVRQPDRALALLKAIEAGTVSPTDLDPQRLRELLKHPRADVKELAIKVLKSHMPEDRKKVLERYRDAIVNEGDAARGKLVFQKNCATCHHVAGAGVTVGPDISDTREKSRAQLLNDILNPNDAIDANYIEYTVTLKNGRTVSGIIVTDTGGSITLKRAENVSETVLRQDVDEVQSTGRSLMPEGQEKNINVAEMTDLISFLKNWRYLDGSVPLGSGK